MHVIYFKEKLKSWLHMENFESPHFIDCNQILKANFR